MDFPKVAACGTGMAEVVRGGTAHHLNFGIQK